MWKAIETLVKKKRKYLDFLIAFDHNHNHNFLHMYFKFSMNI